MTDVPVLCIGDVHGHVDRLEALLEKTGARDKECIIVQLGDLGHFGSETQADDLKAWQMAQEGLVDYVLWGNHDRAVVSSNHHFGGYHKPGPEVLHIMRLMEAEGRLLFAYEAHGWFLSHAGLHENFKDQPHPDEVDLADPTSVTDWLNRAVGISMPKEVLPVIDAVGRARGGWSCCGGILWRDISEPLYDAFPQVFGHSANKDHLVQGEQDKWYCVDIGGKGGWADPDADCIAGIWLPSQEIVRVDMHKEA